MTALATARQLLGLPLGLASAIVLARLYAPSDLGRFAAVAFVVSLPALVGDLGLSQGFIRGREDPDESHLRTAAALQLWIAIAASPIVLIAMRFGGGEPSARWLSLAAALYLPTLLAALGLRANVLTARRLDFARLAVLDLGQQAGYIALLAALGWMRTGAAGIVLATAASQLARLSILARWYPVRPKIVARFDTLSSELRTGLALHGTGILSGFHAGLVNWLGMPLVGAVGVGYLRWSLDITSRLGNTLAQAVGRVAFPTVALLQDDEPRIGRVLARACRYNTLLTGVPLALLAGLATPLVTVIFGGRWVPAAPALRIFALHLTLGAFLIPLDAAVRVVRPAVWSLVLMAGYLAAEVALAIGLAGWLGLIAIPLAQLIATVPVLAILRALLPIAVRPGWRLDLFLPLLASAVAYGTSAAAASALPPWPAMVVGGVTGFAGATAVVFVVGRANVWPGLVRDLARLLAAPRPA